MKKSKIFYAGFLFLSLFVLSGLVCSCESEPEPKLTKPIVTLTLSEKSPQTEVLISWTPSDDAEYYTVERTMIRDSVTEERRFQWSKENELCSKDDDKFYLIDNTCECGTEYTYVVTASVQRYVPITYKTYSEESVPKSITTAADPKVTLAYPKNVKVEPSAEKRNALTVSWDSVENAAEYEVYFVRGYWSLYNEDFEKIATVTNTSYIVEHLANETSYTFMIKAINDDRSSVFSAKGVGQVAPAKNLTKSKAVMLENNVVENFYSDAESLWFKCTPQEGVLSFNYNYVGNKFSLSVFSGDGTVLASGLPLFFINEEENMNVNVSCETDEEDEFYFHITRNIKNDIPGFSPGTTYILRLVNCDTRFAICVE